MKNPRAFQKAFPVTIIIACSLAIVLLYGCSGPSLNEFMEREPAALPNQAAGSGPANAESSDNGGGDSPQSRPNDAASDATPTLGATSTAVALAGQDNAIPATSTPVNTPTAQRTVPTRALRPTSNPAPLGAAVAKINISSLAVRRFPLDDAPTVGAVREGDEYSVSALSRDGKWVRLETPIEAGGRGWVAARFVSVFGEITGILITDGLELGYNNVALASNQALANTGERRLRIRSGPGASFDTVFFAFNGELFIILEESENGDWVHLSNPSMNVDGWAARQFLRLASDPIPTARPSPTSTPTVLLSPPTARPTVVRPTATAVLAGSTPASTTVSTTPAAEAIGTPTPVPAVPAGTTSSDERITIVTDGARLRVRSEPTTDSEIVARVLNGESYAVIELTEDGEWTRIALDDGNSGWVSTRFTRSVGEAGP